MNKAIPILFMTGFMFFFECHKDQPNAPSGSNNEPLAEARIGAEGGILSADLFSLTVPKGAFSSSVTLQLYQDSSGLPYEQSAVSKLFRIEGLPEEIFKPLRCSLKYQGALSDENFIAVGEDVFVKSLGQTTPSYSLFPATDSTGFLVFNLTVPDDMIESPNALYRRNDIHDWIQLLALTGLHSYTTPSDHFIVIGEKSKTSEAQLQNAGLKLENAYTLFENKGFSYQRRTDWPIPVIIKDIHADPSYIIWGYYSSSKFLESHGYITLNTQLLEDDKQWAVVSGHEFFHLVQDLYDPRDWESKIHNYSSHYWLDEATAVYSEEFFTDTPLTYVSGSFSYTKWMPFHGLHVEGKKAGEHGYGCAAIIKYLSGQFLSFTLLNLYRDIQLSKHPVEAVIFNANETTDWWEPFFRDYIMGKIYNVQSSFWIENENKEITFVIDSKDDIHMEKTYLYQDLSAEPFKVDLNYPDIGKNTVISFSIGGALDEETEISVFKYNSRQEMEFIDHSPVSVTARDIKDLTENGGGLLAVITNRHASPPYTNKTEITLDIDVVAEPQIQSCSINVRGIDSAILTEYDNGTSSQSNSTFSAGFPSFKESEIKLSGNTVTQTHDFIGSDGNYYTGTMTIVFDDDKQNITSFSADATIIDDVAPYKSTRIWSISGKDIPLKTDSQNSLFKVEGAEVCSHIKEMTWSMNYVGSRIETLMPGWTCSDESELEVWIYSE